MCNLQATGQGLEETMKQLHCKNYDKGASVLYLRGICEQQVRFLQEKMKLESSLRLPL